MNVDLAIEKMNDDDAKSYLYRLYRVLEDITNTDRPCYDILLEIERGKSTIDMFKGRCHSVLAGKGLL